MKEIFKRSRAKLIISIVSALLTVMVLAFAAYAWFAANRNVSATEMRIQVDTTSNLVISNTPSFTGATNTVAMTAVSRKLLPAMHVDDEAPMLQYMNSSVTIDKTTGLPTVESSEAYTLVTVADDSKYYIDYVVYISSESKALSGATLTAKISQPPSNDAKPFYDATSIDFYIDGEYKETLNIAGLDIASNDTGYDPSAIKKTATLLEGGRIPCLNDAVNKYIKVTMRCYFDGALHSSATKTYVNTVDVQTDGLTLGISFEATGTDANPTT